MLGKTINAASVIRVENIFSSLNLALWQTDHSGDRIDKATGQLSVDLDHDSVIRLCCSRPGREYALQVNDGNDLSSQIANPDNMCGNLRCWRD